MDKLTNMAAFLAVVDRGGFTRAGEHLGLSRAAVSKYVMQLEEHLGARLLNRTTRTHSLTAIGEGYMPRCRAILADVADADACATEASGALRGRLRLSAPVSLGARKMGEMIAAFCRAHPAVQVELVLNDSFVDVIAEGFDVVLRIANLSDSSLIARKIADMSMIACAAPHYLEAMGRPSMPDDLKHHSCLIYDNNARNSVWRFERKTEPQEVRVSGPLAANNGDALADAARAGLGIALLPQFIVADDLRDGHLEPVLPDWQSPDIAMSAVFPSKRFLSARVRAFIDHATTIYGKNTQ